MSALLETDSLSFSYTGSMGEKKLHVLDNISLSIRDDSFLCILGPSGCGKSTLLKLISSMIPSDSGSISGGLLFDGKKPVKPDTGRIIIFQDDDQLFPWLDVSHNVSFPLRLAGDRQWKEKSGAMIEKVHLAGFEEYYPHELSGGMKKRAIIARALVTSPRLLLMDEPFGSLDAQTRKKLHSLLFEIKEKLSFAVIFVTHDIHEAIYLASDIAVMGRGGNIVYSAENRFSGISDFSSHGFADFYNKLCSFIDEP